MLVVNCPERVVALVAARLEPTQADYERYVLSPETVTAIGMAAEHEAIVESELRAGRRAEVAQQFREQYPALSRWRDRVLNNPRRVSGQEVAAAYELLALECSLAGIHDLADDARLRARLTLGIGRRDG